MSGFYNNPLTDALLRLRRKREEEERAKTIAPDLYGGENNPVGLAPLTATVERAPVSRLSLGFEEPDPEEQPDPLARLQDALRRARPAPSTLDGQAGQIRALTGQPAPSMRSLEPVAPSQAGPRPLPFSQPQDATDDPEIISQRTFQRIQEERPAIAPDPRSTAERRIGNERARQAEEIEMERGPRSTPLKIAEQFIGGAIEGVTGGRRDELLSLGSGRRPSAYAQANRPETPGEMSAELGGNLSGAAIPLVGTARALNALGAAAKPGIVQNVLTGGGRIGGAARGAIEGLPYDLTYDYEGDKEARDFNVGLGTGAGAVVGALLPGPNPANALPRKPRPPQEALREAANRTGEVWDDYTRTAQRFGEDSPEARRILRAVEDAQDAETDAFSAVRPVPEAPLRNQAPAQDFTAPLERAAEIGVQQRRSAADLAAAEARMASRPTMPENPEFVRRTMDDAATAPIEQRAPIRAAAMRHKSTGRIYEGYSHPDAVDAAIADGAIGEDDFSEWHLFDEGFTDHGGHFLSRAEVGSRFGSGEAESLNDSGLIEAGLRDLEPLAEQEPERIVGAAVRTDDGRVFADAMHAFATERATEAGAFIPGQTGKVDGFVTSTGRFVTRDEAQGIAEAANQTNAPGKTRMDSMDVGKQQRVNEFVRGEVVDGRLPPAAGAASPDALRALAGAGAGAVGGAALDENDLRGALVGGLAGAGIGAGPSLLRQAPVERAESPNLLRTRVVDDTGAPRTVYHGTPHTFNDFDPSKSDPDALYGPGLYFTENPAVADTPGYRGNVDSGKHQRFANVQEARRRTARGLSALREMQEKGRGGPDVERMIEEHETAIRDYDSQIAAGPGGDAPNIRPARLAVERPFDVDGRYGWGDIARILKVAGADEAATYYAQRARSAPSDRPGQEVYNVLAQELGGKPQANAALRAAGYDGITHVGGHIAGDGSQPHRVWVAFDRKQVRNPFGPAEDAAQWGAAPAGVVGSLLSGSAGAAIGAAVDDEGSPWEGALAGGLAGLGAGAALGRVGRRAAQEAGESLPDVADAAQGATARVDDAVDAAPEPRPFRAEDWINLETMGLDSAGRQRYADTVQRLVESGEIQRTTVTWEETRKQAVRLARDMGVDPAEFLKKGKRLDGAEMLAVRNIIAQNMEAQGRLLEELKTLTPADPKAEQRMEDINRLLNSLDRDTDRWTVKLFGAKSQAGRDLNSLKILANRSLDPVAWSVKARQVKGVKLSKGEQAILDRLVRAAQESEGGVTPRRAPVQTPAEEMDDIDRLFGPPKRKGGANDFFAGVDDAPARARTPRDPAYKPDVKPGEMGGAFKAQATAASIMDDGKLRDTYLERLKSAAHLTADVQDKAGSYRGANLGKAEQRVAALREEMNARGMPLPFMAEAFAKDAEKIGDQFADDAALETALSDAEVAMQRAPGDRKTVARYYALEFLARNRGLLGDESGAALGDMARVGIAAAGGAGVGAWLDEENRGRGALIGAGIAGGTSALGAGIRARRTGADAFDPNTRVGRIRQHVEGAAQATGKTEEEMLKEARILGKGGNMLRSTVDPLNFATPERIELIQYVASLRQASMMEKGSSLFRASLLSNPATHVVNATGNTMNAAAEIAKDVPAAGLDRVVTPLVDRLLRSSGEDVRAMRTKPLPGRLSLKEYGAGFGEGARRVPSIMRGEIQPEDLQKWDIPRQIHFDNPVLEAATQTVFRALDAGDKPFYLAATRKAWADAAIVEAMAEGVQGADLERRALEIMRQPPNEEALERMTRAANEVAAVMTFKDETNIGNLLRGFGKIPVAGTLTVPFQRTPGAVATRTFEWMGGGIPSGIVDLAQVFRAASRGEQLTDLQRSGVEKLARGLMGLGLATPVGAGAMLYKAGMLTGSYPSNPEERRIWQQNGTTEHSIYIPEAGWVSLARLAPIGNQLGIGATMAKAMEEDPGLMRSGDENTGRLLAAGANTLLDLPMFSAFSDMADAARGEKTAGQYVRQRIASLVPAAVGAVERAVDPEIRATDPEPQEGRAATFLEGAQRALQARIPGLSDDLEAEPDVFGEPRRGPGGLLNQTVNPLRFSPDRREEDDVIRMLDRLGVGVSKPTRDKIDDLDKEGRPVLTPDGSVRQRRETPQELRERMRDVGPKIKERLAIIFAGQAPARYVVEGGRRTESNAWRQWNAFHVEIPKSVRRAVATNPDLRGVNPDLAIRAKQAEMIQGVISGGRRVLHKQHRAERNERLREALENAQRRRTAN